MLKYVGVELGEDDGVVDGSLLGLIDGLLLGLIDGLLLGLIDGLLLTTFITNSTLSLHGLGPPVIATLQLY